MSCGHGTTVVPPLALHSVCVCVRAHRHDKWLIFDLGEERPLLGLSILGVVDSFAPARAPQAEHVLVGQPPEAQPLVAGSAAAESYEDVLKRVNLFGRLFKAMISPKLMPSALSR